MADIVSTAAWPDPMTYAMAADERGCLTPQEVRMTARCKVCRKRLGEVFATEQGPLWVGQLGGNRDGRVIRQGTLTKAGHDTDGRNMVAQWVEEWRPSYICDCRCRRNSADGRVVYGALLAGKVDVDIPPQR